jgi:hypothetical protein
MVCGPIQSVQRFVKLTLVKTKTAPPGLSEHRKRPPKP